MVTRFRVGTNRPTQHLNLHVSLVSPLPKSYCDAFNDPNWQNAMCDEYNALIKNNTRTLVPRPTDTNIVRCMWLFRHKYLADGTLSRYKARLVANGSTQLEGIDVDETFSPVVKSGTIRTWPLYGLKQAPRAWFQRFASYITRVGFHHSRCDSSLFIYRQGADTAYLLLYVDDIVLTASSETLLQITRMFLSQRKYAIEILEQAGMASCNSSRTLVDTESKLGDDGDPVSDLTLYQSLAGSLQYLTFTRPDISYVVQQVCLYMHDPREPYFSALKWVLSAEAEYHGVANAVAKTCWLRNLLRELHTPLSSATLIYCDNVSAVYLSCNLVQHQCTKHIEIDRHFVRDLVAAGQVRVLHVPFRYQYADIFTKGLPSALFEEFRSSLSIRCPPAPTAREC
ncbi:ribonuclease H-like domain-containing protein [Tanacetum coccineum]